MRYLVTVKLNDGPFIHLITEFSQTICLEWKSEKSFNFSSTKIYALGESFQVEERPD